MEGGHSHHRSRGFEVRKADKANRAELREHRALQAQSEVWVLLCEAFMGLAGE